MGGRLAPLFEPFQLGSLRLPNRFIMAPMTRSFSPGGVPGPDVAQYYKSRALGEVGLIVTEGVGIPHPAAIGFSGVDVLDIPSMYGEQALAGWKKVVEEVHSAGGLIAPQLWHQGGMRVHGTGEYPDATSMRPSGVWGPTDRSSLVKREYIDQVKALTRPMTEEEIADVIGAYAAAAASARDLGFDAIAIHGAHGYLIDSFLWIETNRRVDRWGGDFTRRSRFACEVVRAIKQEVGAQLPLIFRFSQWKLQDVEARLASRAEELAMILQPLADAGVDAFDVSERNFDAPAFLGSPLGLAGWVRKVTGIPTIAVGSVGLKRWLFETGKREGLDVFDNLGTVLERYLNSEFDLVGVGRMLIANPDWVRRARLDLPFSGYATSLLRTLS